VGKVALALDPSGVGTRRKRTALVDSESKNESEWNDVSEMVRRATGADKLREGTTEAETMGKTLSHLLRHDPATHISALEYGDRWLVRRALVSMQEKGRHLFGELLYAIKIMCSMSWANLKAITLLFKPVLEFFSVDFAKGKFYAAAREAGKLRDEAAEVLLTETTSRAGEKKRIPGASFSPAKWFHAEMSTPASRLVLPLTVDDSGKLTLVIAVSYDARMLAFKTPRPNTAGFIFFPTSPNCNRAQNCRCFGMYDAGEDAALIAEHWEEMLDYLDALESIGYDDSTRGTDSPLMKCIRTGQTIHIVRTAVTDRAGHKSALYSGQPFDANPSSQSIVQQQNVGDCTLFFPMTKTVVLNLWAEKWNLGIDRDMEAKIKKTYGRGKDGGGLMGLGAEGVLIDLLHTLGINVIVKLFRLIMAMIDEVSSRVEGQQHLANLVYKRLKQELKIYMFRMGEREAIATTKVLGGRRFLLLHEELFWLPADEDEEGSGDEAGAPRREPLLPETAISMLERFLDLMCQVHEGLMAERHVEHPKVLQSLLHKMCRLWRLLLPKASFTQTLRTIMDQGVQMTLIAKGHGTCLNSFGMQAVEHSHSGHKQAFFRQTNKHHTSQTQAAVLRSQHYLSGAQEALVEGSIPHLEEMIGAFANEGMLLEFNESWQGEGSVSFLTGFVRGLDPEGSTNVRARCARGPCSLGQGLMP